jgi:hypothetical protein
MGPILLGNKSTVIILTLAVLAAAAWLAERQINHAAATPLASQVHLIKDVQGPPVSAAQASEESSAAAGGSSDSGSSSSSHTSLTVNGRNIPIPQNGSVSQTIDNGDSTTTINAQTSSNSEQTSQGSAHNTSHTSLNVHVNSQSSSSESTGQ